MHDVNPSRDDAFNARRGQHRAHSDHGINGDYCIDSGTRAGWCLSAAPVGAGDVPRVQPVSRGRRVAGLSAVTQPDVGYSPFGGRRLRRVGGDEFRPALGDEGIDFGRILEDLVGESGAATPLVFLAVVVESGNLGSVGADVQLETQIERILIPRGVGSAGGIAKDRTCLSELLQGIKGCRMLESGQGTGKQVFMADLGG